MNWDWIISNSIFTTLSGIGILAAGLGFAYSQVKIGSVKAKDELIVTLKETAVVEREKAARLADEKTTLIQSHQDQINQLSKEIGKLQGLLQANEVKIKEYTDILQGRSPEQTKFMEYMTQIAADSSKYMRDSSGVLNEIKTFMALMNGEIAKGNMFNKEIELATRSGKGKPLLK